jgi:hypothetical protein
MLRSISKIAFLGNLAFVVVAAMHWLPNTSNWDQALVSNLVITAYFIATTTTLIANIWALYLFLKKRPIPIEKWLVWINLVFLILQIIYFNAT